MTSSPKKAPSERGSSCACCSQKGACFAQKERSKPRVWFAGFGGLERAAKQKEKESRCVALESGRCRNSYGGSRGWPLFQLLCILRKSQQVGGGSLLKSWQLTQAWNGILSACLPKGKHKTCSLLPACWGCNKRGPTAAAPVLPPLNWSALQDGRTRCFLSSESLCRTSSAEPGSGPARNAKETHSVDGEGREERGARLGIQTYIYLLL